MRGSRFWGRGPRGGSVFVVAEPRGEAGAVGAVLAGNPFRRDKRERAGLRGNVDLGVVELARSFGEIGDDADRACGWLRESGRGEEQRGERCDDWTRHGAGTRTF